MSERDEPILADVIARLGGLRTDTLREQAGIDQIPAPRSETRTVLMERIDRLHDTLPGIHADIEVNFARADTAANVNDHTCEELRDLREVVNAMACQIQRCRSVCAR